MANSSVTASYDSSFAVILRGLLKRSPVTGGKTPYKTLAEYLDVKQQSVSSWANGTTMPDTKHIAPIADYFGVSCDYLLGRATAHNHDTADVCEVTPLAPETVEVLKLYKKGKSFEGEPISNNDLEIRALNHVISNCNALLTHIGLYLFAEIEGAENVKIKNTAINLKEPTEFFRNGMLKAITYTLKNYRAKLQANGGDLPLTAVLDETQKDKEGRVLQKRIEFLEGLGQRKLTDNEIEQQRIGLKNNGGVESGNGKISEE